MQHLPTWARQWTFLLAAGAFALGVAIVVWPLFERPPAPAEALPLVQEFEPEGASAEAPQERAGEPQPSEGPLVVYISGAVRAPDVYQLPSAARVKDLVLAAGGLAEDADPAAVNLADRLADGQHIHIPRQGEAAPSSDVSIGEASAPAEGALIDINTTSAAGLEALPGVGTSLAERIVEYRSANGPFQAVEDLQNVKGIGPALFAKIAPLITVGR